MWGLPFEAPKSEGKRGAATIPGSHPTCEGAVLEGEPPALSHLSMAEAP
jgi:hypothetical protein